MMPQWLKLENGNYYHESRFGTAHIRLSSDKKRWSTEVKSVTSPAYCHSFTKDLQEAIEICERGLGLDGYIVTYPSLSKVYPLNPDPDEIWIEDIAHHLSMTCRYKGGVRFHYSVAQHSVLVSYSVPSEHQFAALMHDASEYVFADVPSPVKRKLPKYEEAEMNFLEVIYQKYGIPFPYSEEVHQADIQVRVKEQMVLRGINDMSATPALVEIEQWSPAEAEAKFMSRFDELYNETSRVQKSA